MLRSNIIQVPPPRRRLIPLRFAKLSIAPELPEAHHDAGLTQSGLILLTYLFVNKNAFALNFNFLRLCLM